MSKKWIIALVVLLVLIGAVVGYSQVKRSGEKKSQDKSQESNSGKDKKEKEKSDKKGSTGVDGEDQETAQINLYFAESELEYLLPEARNISSAQDRAEQSIKELIKGPKKSGRYATIPQGTKLIDLNIKEGVAYADFSQELIDNHSGGSAGELMTVYSIVNTLTQFPEIDKVQILVGGKEVETLAGHMDLTQPLSEDKNIVK